MKFLQVINVLEFLQYLWGIETNLKHENITFYLKVFTVPMRNWNGCIYSIQLFITSFLQYLWGIETDTNLVSYFYFIEFLQYLFTVPMRNWNAFSANFFCLVSSVFTVPMRKCDVLVSTPPGEVDGLY